MCGDNIAWVIASMRGSVASDVGAFQAQTPVKPVPLDLLVRESLFAQKAAESSSP